MTESRPDKKPLGFFEKHRFFFCFFLFLSVYHVLIVNQLNAWKLSDMLYSILCVDFSFGFASKLLPGAIFNAVFGAHASRETAEIFTVALVFLVFIGVAAFGDIFMRRVPDKHKNTALVLLLLFMSGAYTFSIFTKSLGIIDTYWLVFFLLFFVFLENKILRFLIPLVFVGALMIHFAALVFFIPIVAIILLYRASVAKSKGDRAVYISIFTISVIATAVFFFLLVLNETQTVCPIDEFRAKLLERGADNSRYYDYSFFHLIDGRNFIPESVEATKSPLLKFAKLFYYQIKITYDLLKADVVHGVVTTVTGILVLAPVIAIFIKTHLEVLKSKENGLRRFCAFLMLVQIPFVFVTALLFAVSVDMTRYYTHLFLGAFMCFLTVLFYEEKLRDGVFERLGTLKNSLGVKIYILAYMLFTLMPD